MSFIYKGVEYDVEDYIQKHPGGPVFLENMANERKDFTEYFRTLHSDEAEKVIRSLPVVGKVPASVSGERYFELLEKIKVFYKADWPKEVAMMTFVLALYLTAIFTTFGLLSALCYALAQIVTGWMAHSMAHSRIPSLHRLAQVVSGIIGGFSLKWWSEKHNMHHMFTNSKRYDEDIQHEYKKYLFPFLFLKWRVDSMARALRDMELVPLSCIALGYALMLCNVSNLKWFLLGMLVGGFYTAFVLVGNHEKEKTYSGRIEDDFFTHQI